MLISWCALRPSCLQSPASIQSDQLRGENIDSICLAVTSPESFVLLARKLFPSSFQENESFSGNFQVLWPLTSSGKSPPDLPTNQSFVLDAEAEVFIANV
jgi:hypothetical protein